MLWTALLYFPTLGMNLCSTRGMVARILLRKSESSSASQITSLPRVLQSSSSALQQRQQENQPVVKVSSGNSFIPPNRPVSQILRSEIQTILSELCFVTSFSSRLDNEQDKTIIEEPSPMVRPNWSTRLIKRKARLERYSDLSYAPSSPIPGP